MDSLPPPGYKENDDAAVAIVQVADWSGCRQG